MPVPLGRARAADTNGRPNADRATLAAAQGTVAYEGCLEIRYVLHRGIVSSAQDTKFVRESGAEMLFVISTTDARQNSLDGLPR